MQNRWAIYGDPAPLLAVVVTQLAVCNRSLVVATRPFATRLCRVRAGRDSIQFKSFNSNSNHQRPKHLLTNGRYTATHSVSYELDQTNLDELVGFDDGGDPVHKVNRFVLVSGSCTGSGNCGRDKIYKILDPLGGDQSKNHCE